MPVLKDHRPSGREYKIAAVIKVGDGVCLWGENSHYDPNGCLVARYFMTLKITGV